MDDRWEGRRHDTVLYSLRISLRIQETTRMSSKSHVAKSYANCTERNRLFIERTHVFGDRFMYLSYRYVIGSALISSLQPCFGSVMLPTVFFLWMREEKGLSRLQCSVHFLVFLKIIQDFQFFLIYLKLFQTLCPQLSSVLWWQ